MDLPTIALLTLALALILAVLVIAGLTLGARAFTQLLELTHFIGSLAAAYLQGSRPVPTISSEGTESDSSSPDPSGTPITPASVDSSSTDSTPTMK